LDISHNPDGTTKWNDEDALDIINYDEHDYEKKE
jgi:hypothetical protein